MADCSQFGGQICKTVQVIAPDVTTPTGTLGGPDQALDEFGDVLLTPGVGIITVAFQTTKAGEYRFEYLYIDALGLGSPEIIPIVPVTQTVYGFTVDLGAYPLLDGYILRWHVVVVSTVQTPGALIDAPESIRIGLPQASTFTIPFVHPRSTATYGFTELRVENLTDPAALQTPVLVQVVAKTTLDFTIAIWPTLPNDHYFLVVRTP